MINSVTIEGRLGANPESRAAGSSSISHASIAHTTWKPPKERGGQGEETTTWFDVEAWDNRGVSRFPPSAVKGATILVSGVLKIDEYNDRDGRQVRKAKIMAASIAVSVEAGGRGDYNNDRRDDRQGGGGNDRRDDRGHDRQGGGNSGSGYGRDGGGNRGGQGRGGGNDRQGRNDDRQGGGNDRRDDRGGGRDERSGPAAGPSGEYMDEELPF